MNQPNATVSIRDTSFEPAAVTIQSGQRVRWVNDDSTVHIIASNPAGQDCQPASPIDFLSYDLHHGDAFEYIFRDPGTYHYHCYVRGCAMAGSVTVK